MCTELSHWWLKSTGNCHSKIGLLQGSDTENDILIYVTAQARKKGVLRDFLFSHLGWPNILICLELRDHLGCETFNAKIGKILVKSGWSVILIYGTKSWGVYLLHFSCVCLIISSLRMNTISSLQGFLHPFLPFISYPPNVFYTLWPQTLMETKTII